TSSIAVYGPAQLPMREDTLPIPEDPYGIAKLAVEQDLKAAHHMFGLDYVVFRPHNVYGEFQNIGDKYRNVIGIFMNRLLQGLDMPVFGDGGQTRAFTYVGDIAPLIAKSVTVPEAYNEAFNVGADTVTTVKELAYLVAEVMGMDPNLSYHEARKEVQHAYSDHSKVRRIFGDVRETPLKQGLQCMADWVKTVGSRQSQDFGNIEIAQNLPSRWVSK
ncbi:MAG: NAD-dependent epimerase/dehydratase family protein, partial [Caldilineaceae bacterium]|nr:NAD-dependent epimerase/dehydratase family protein [Caldilineaceae bacterium]